MSGARPLLGLRHLRLIEDDPWVTLVSVLTRAGLDELLLVLEAVQLRHRVVTLEVPRWLGSAPWSRLQVASAWELQVRSSDRQAAVEQLSSFGREQVQARRERELPLVPTPWPLPPLVATGLGLASLWAALHLLSGPRAGRGPWFSLGAMRPEAVWSGQAHRLVSACYLHADPGHLAGNIGFGLLFFLAVAQLWGPGLTLLVWLLGAVAGMATSAAWHAGETLSVVGASGGVFGLLGAAGAWAARRAAHRWTGLFGRQRLMAAVGATLGLFAWTGFSPSADVAAHAGGLACGAAIGWLLPALSPGRGAWRWQWLAAAAWLGLSLAGWWPLLRPGG